ncbi:MAG: hypothetical protein PT120_11820 [Aphanizomenon gracile PMC649.10]|nr:hypothetical protein [Aphanizomenon gracile PMC649.10]
MRTPSNSKLAIAPSTPKAAIATTSTPRNQRSHPPSNPPNSGSHPHSTPKQRLGLLNPQIAILHPLNSQTGNLNN